MSLAPVFVCVCIRAEPNRCVAEVKVAAHRNKDQTSISLSTSTSSSLSWLSPCLFYFSKWRARCLSVRACVCVCLNAVHTCTSTTDTHTHKSRNATKTLSVCCCWQLFHDAGPPQRFGVDSGVQIILHTHLADKHRVTTGLIGPLYLYFYVTKCVCRLSGAVFVCSWKNLAHQTSH